MNKNVGVHRRNNSTLVQNLSAVLSYTPINNIIILRLIKILKKNQRIGIHFFNN